MISSIIGMRWEFLQWRHFASYIWHNSVTIHPQWEQTLWEQPIPSQPVPKPQFLTLYWFSLSQTNGVLAQLCMMHSVPVWFHLMLMQGGLLRCLCDLDDHPPWTQNRASFQWTCPDMHGIWCQFSPPFSIRVLLAWLLYGKSLYDTQFASSNHPLPGNIHCLPLLSVSVYPSGQFPQYIPEHLYPKAIHTSLWSRTGFIGSSSPIFRMRHWYRPHVYLEWGISVVSALRSVSVLLS